MAPLVKNYRLLFFVAALLVLIATALTLPDGPRGDKQVKVSTGPDARPDGVSSAPEPKPVPPPKKKTEMLAAAWLPYWDMSAALSSIDRAGGALDVASPFWYKSHKEGRVVDLPGAGSRNVISFLRARKIAVIPTISAFSATETAAVISDKTKTRRLIDDLGELADTPGFDGIEIDYEGLRPRDRADFSRFIQLLARRVHSGGKQLIVTVPARTGGAGDSKTSRAYNYKALGEAADSFRIMAYDQHYTGGPSGPVASITWVEEAIKYAAARIPANKIILGVPAYGYDWPLDGGQGKSVVFDDVTALSGDGSADVRWDAESASPYVEYESDSGKRIIWFENQRSFKRKYDLARRYRLAGIAIWRLGHEDSEIFNVLE